jgi:hypothetical protein
MFGTHSWLPAKRVRGKWLYDHDAPVSTLNLDNLVTGKQRLRGLLLYPHCPLARSNANTPKPIQSNIRGIPRLYSWIVFEITPRRALVFITYRGQHRDSNFYFGKFSGLAPGDEGILLVWTLRTYYNRAAQPLSKV